MAERFEQDLHDMDGSNESAAPLQDTSDSTAPTQTPTRQHTRHTPTPTRRTEGPKQGKLPPWKVVLHNDHINLMEDVVKTILQLTPLSQQAAIRRMLEAHARGRALLMTTHRERAELYKQQFASKRLTVTIGPV